MRIRDGAFCQKLLTLTAPGRELDIGFAEGHENQELSPDQAVIAVMRHASEGRRFQVGLQF